MSDSRQRSRSGRVLKLTITIDSFGGVIATAAALSVRCPPAFAWPHRPMSSAAARRRACWSVALVPALPPSAALMQRRRLGHVCGGRHVGRRGTVDLASHRRIEHEDGDARGERFQRRQPESFVLGQEREDRCAAVEGGQLPLVYIAANLDPFADTVRGRDRLEDPGAARCGSRRRSRGVLSADRTWRARTPRSAAAGGGG